MLTLRDIMTRDVATLGPDDTLRDAITMLSERYITGAPVVSGEAVVGVVSAMDIMDFAASTQATGADSAMQDEWPLDDPGQDATSSYFTELWDTGGDGPEEHEHGHDALREHTVGEVMTRSLLMLAPGTEIHEAAAFMLEHGVHRLLVAADGRLEGLVTTTDFLRVIADRRI
ncbi:MAG TPA: CBS domain-containing protein [Longimicrobiales bacterium]|nr:CBS domain-containing protein [Longimicrobiales bacterium]